MRIRNILSGLALLLLTALPQGVLAQQQKISIVPTDRQVSYAARRTLTNSQEKKKDRLLDMMKTIADRTRAGDGQDRQGRSDRR